MRETRVISIPAGADGTLEIVRPGERVERVSLTVAGGAVTVVVLADPDARLHAPPPPPDPERRP